MGDSTAGFLANALSYICLHTTYPGTASADYVLSECTCNRQRTQGLFTLAVFHGDAHALLHYGFFTLRCHTSVLTQLSALPWAPVCDITINFAVC